MPDPGIMNLWPLWRVTTATREWSREEGMHDVEIETPVRALTSDAAKECVLRFARLEGVGVKRVTVQPWM